MYTDMITLQTMDTLFYEAQRQGRISFYLTTIERRPSTLQLQQLSLLMTMSSVRLQAHACMCSSLTILPSSMHKHAHHHLRHFDISHYIVI